MKKIIYVITKSNFGGAQKYVYELATALPKREYDVLVVFGGKGELADKLERAGIRTLSLRSLGRDISIWKDYRAFKQLIHIFKKEKPDIVHLNSSKIGGLGALAARIARVPRIIFTAHGWAFKESSSFVKTLLKKVLSWFTLIFSHHTIAVSHDDHNRVSHWPFVSTKISTIHVGVTPPNFLSAEHARQALASHIDKPISFLQNKDVVMTIAELTPNKGLGYALRAMKNIRDAVYLIVGDGEDRTYLEDDIRMYDLADRVFLLGKIPAAATLLKGCDIFLLPSIKEGLSYVLLEAGLAQRPIVATNVGGNPEVIIHRKTGLLVPPKKPFEIHHTISELLTSQTSQGQLSKALHEHVRTSFSFSAMLKETRHQYEN